MSFIVVFLYFVILVTHIVSFPGRADENITTFLLVFAILFLLFHFFSHEKWRGETHRALQSQSRSYVVLRKKRSKNLLLEQHIV